VSFEFWYGRLERSSCRSRISQNVNNGAWTSKTRIREALAIAVAMGANTVRALLCASSVGDSTEFHLKPTLETWNEKAVSFESLQLFSHSMSRS
jgi:hypothetical protein